MANAQPKQQAAKNGTGASSVLGGFLGDVLDYMEAALIAIACIIFLYAFVTRPVVVEGTSMYPTLHDKDILFLWSPGYSPQPGDIIVTAGETAGLFSDAAQTNIVETEGIGTQIVKRVIATAGQTIAIDASIGTVTVDGSVLDEPYLNAQTLRDDLAFDYPITIPEGYVFVMGDNRMHSTDSRNPLVGLVPVKEIYGVAFARIWRDPSERSAWTENFDWIA